MCFVCVVVQGKMTRLHIEDRNIGSEDEALCIHSMEIYLHSQGHTVMRTRAMYIRISYNPICIQTFFTANICVCPRAVHLYRIPHTSYPILKYTEEYTYKFTHLQIHLPTCLPINISIYTSLFILYIYIHLFYFFCFIYLSILQVNLIETNQSIDLNVCDTIQNINC